MVNLLDLRLQAEQYIGTAMTGVASFVIDNPASITLGTISLLAAGAASGMYLHVRRNKGEDDAMKRRAMLDEKYADMIGDGLFDMLCRDEIDRHEYKKACRRFGMAYRLSDLLVAKNKKRGMKSRVKNNIRTTKLLDASGDPIQPRIPGPKPAEVVPVPQRKQPKIWIAKGKSLLRKVA